MLVDLTTAPDRPVDNPRGSGALLERVTAALSATLDFREVFRGLAELTTEATGAQRCSLFLLEDHELQPAVSRAPHPDPKLFSAFRSMGPVRLGRRTRRLLLEGRAVPITDARESDIVPAAWVEAFSLRAVALVPLMAGVELCGLMTVDWESPRAFVPDELRLLEALGSSAGMAVRNARLHDQVQRRARLQTALARAGASLAYPLSPTVIGQRLVEAYTELLPARLSAVGRVDRADGRLEVLASHGGIDLPSALTIADIPTQLVGRVQAAWATSGGPPTALALDDDAWFAEVCGGRRAGAEKYLLLPLVVDGRVWGLALVGLGAHARLDDEEQEAAKALATIAAAALERHHHLQRQARQLEQADALYRASITLSEGSGAGTLVQRLNELLCGHGIEVVGVAFRDRALGRHLGGDEPSAEERAAWRAADGWATLADGSLSVPLRLGRRLVGGLRVRADPLDADDRSFLETLARGLADVARRSALRAAVEVAARERAVAAERDRMAADLHDTAGQLFVAIKLLARRESEQHTTGDSAAACVERLAELAEQGKWEIEQAVRALAFVPVSRRGLLPAVRALARSIANDSGIDISVAVEGRSARLGARTERALYRVAHEALTNAWRHANCAHVEVRFSYLDRDTVLTVSDDGSGLDPSRESEGLHIGIGGMRRAIAEAGGTLRLRPGDRGVVVEARVPREPR